MMTKVTFSGLILPTVEVGKEVMDWTNKNWISERNFPNLLSGKKTTSVLHRD